MLGTTVYTEEKQPTAEQQRRKSTNGREEKLT
jgi:hypothetical protein